MTMTNRNKQNGGRYGDLFVESLRLFGMLCIGIYRVKDPTGTEPTASSRRYVITNPPGDFILMMSDLIFVLLQFDPGLEYHNKSSKSHSSGVKSFSPSSKKADRMAKLLHPQHCSSQDGSLAGRGGLASGTMSPLMASTMTTSSTRPKLTKTSTTNSQHAGGSSSASGQHSTTKTSLILSAAKSAAGNQMLSSQTNTNGPYSFI